MKKSFLSLVTGLVCVSGISSAFAWNEVSISTVQNNVKTLYNKSPLLADANGIALHYNFDSDSLYFTDNYAVDYTYDRKYYVNFYKENAEI